jgi:uncharacterized membrane protein
MGKGGKDHVLDEPGAICYFALEKAGRQRMSEEKKPEEKKRDALKSEEKKRDKTKSSTGLGSNIAGLLSYVLGWITGLIFFLLEEKDEYVRYHAMQSIIFFGAVTVVEVVLEIFGLIPYVDVVFLALQGLVGLFAFVLWVVLMVKAYQGVRYKLPWAGELAEKYSVKK